MIFKQPKQISPHDFMLNSLLDEGLYFKDSKQMLHYIYKYFNKNKLRNIKNPYNYILDNKVEFVNFMQNRLYAKL